MPNYLLLCHILRQNYFETTRIISLSVTTIDAFHLKGILQNFKKFQLAIHFFETCNEDFPINTHGELVRHCHLPHDWQCRQSFLQWAIFGFPHTSNALIDQYWLKSCSNVSVKNWVSFTVPLLANQTSPTRWQLCELVLPVTRSISPFLVTSSLMTVHNVFRRKGVGVWNSLDVYRSNN